jgi:hypothetical protein
MSAKQRLLEQAETLFKVQADLQKACDDAIAAIDAAEARRAAAHKDTMNALDAIFDLLDNFSKPKETAKTDYPNIGLAFVEGVGIREMKP